MQTQSDTKAVLASALSLAELGYPVLPIHPRRKEPATDHGLTDATTDAATIRGWFQDRPQSNVAISTTGLVLVDVDPTNGQANGWPDDADRAYDLSHAKAAATTPRGGRHYFYRRPEGKRWKCSISRVAPDVDIKTAGGYVLVAPSETADGRYTWFDGQELASPPADLSEPPAWLCDLLDGTTSHRGNGQETPPQRKVKAGARNQRLTARAGALRRDGLTGEEIVPVLQRYNAELCDPPLNASEVEKIARGMDRYKPAADDKPLPMTDTGLAERFAIQHADTVCYCHPWAKWLVWDGCRWQPDESGMVNQLSKATARSILREAAAEHDKDQVKALASFALKSESAVRRRAMLQLAQSEPGIPIHPDALDTNQWLLNVTNGTLDLRTGELREHRRSDLITKVAPIEFNSGAAAPTWHDFLVGIFAGNAHIYTFMQRLLGYCLTGTVGEQILPMFYGTGANGKSTLINAFMDVLGPDYSMKAPADFVLLKRGEHPTAQADLCGKRFVACIETDEGRRLAESLVKDLTGGDRIRARRMREDHWEFKPTHKLVIATNHRPEVRGCDHALWRRIALVPFTVTIPDHEQDKGLLEKLRNEASGILRWCVQGCLDWQEHGLQPPEDVRAATSGYQQEQDLIGAFLAECCATTPTATVKASALLDAFRDWSGDRRIPQRRLGRALSERGFDRYSNNGVWYRGVGLTEGTEQRNLK